MNHRSLNNKKHSLKLNECIHWTENSFLHSRSPESTRPSVEVIEVLTGTDMEKAEELARDCMNTQIKMLKTQAEQHMVGSYDP